jgi:hypothetical protein
MMAVDSHEGDNSEQNRMNKSHGGDISKQNCTKAMPYNKIAQRQYFRMKPHEGDMLAKQWSIEHLSTTQPKLTIQNESNRRNIKGQQ